MKKMSKQANRGPNAKLQGKIRSKAKKPIVSYVEGTKPNRIYKKKK